MFLLWTGWPHGAAHSLSLLPPCCLTLCGWPLCLFALLQKNHLSGLQRKLLKLSFWNQEGLLQVGGRLGGVCGRGGWRQDGWWVHCAD